MYAPNANIVTGSFDRNSGTLLNPLAQPYNNFRIQSLGGNIVQGQVNKISVTEVMLPYNTPTIVKGSNDALFLQVFTSTGGAEPGRIVTTTVAVPAGFYTASELAAAIQSAVITASIDLSGIFTATVNPVTNAIVFSNTQTYNSGSINYFIDIAPNVLTGDSRTNPAFSKPQLLWTAGFRSLYANAPPNGNLTINPYTRGPELVPDGTPVALLPPAPSGGWPAVTGAPYTGRYTDFVDIVSTSLSQAQYIRDSSTSQGNPKRDIIARVFVCTNVSTYTTDPAGSRPFTIWRNWTNPKVIKWTADRSIDAIDLSLFDMYGQPLPTSQTFPAQVTGTALLRADCGASDYSITFHVHEPGVEVQNENVGYKF